MRENQVKLGLVLLASCVCCAVAVRNAKGAEQSDALPVEDALNVRSLGQLMSTAFSPDGKWLAYVIQDNRRSREVVDLQAWARTGVPWYGMGADIYLLNVQTGETRNLTGGSGDNWLPKWSPDGHSLSFLSDRGGSGNANLWIWDAIKNDLKNVSTTDLRADALEWTPDSRKILVATIPQALSVEEYVAKIRSGGQGQALAPTTIHGATVTLYRTSKSNKRGRELPTSDPWSLNLALSDLALIDVATGAANSIVRSQKISRFLISPDGSRIAYTSPKRFEKPGSQQILYDLITITLSTMKQRVAASDVRLGFAGDFSWSPDGLWMSYRTYGPGESAFNCYVVDLNGGSPRNVTGLTNTVAVEATPTIWQWPLSGKPLWNSKGDEIYFVTRGVLWRASVSEVKSIEVAQIPDRKITQLVSQSDNILLTSDEGKATVVVAHDDQGKQDGFYRVDLTSGLSVKLLEKGQCYTCHNLREGQFITATKDGKYWAYFAEDSGHDSDLWMSGSNLRNERRLTHLNPQFDKYKMGTGRLIQWLNDDGDRLQGALLLPTDYQEGKRYPLIVFVYGGVLLSDHMSHFGLAYPGPFNMQLFATRGFAVLLPDAPQRLSTPMLDLAKTVLPGVNRVIDLGIADPKRIGLMGHSYGGYSTLALIVQTNRFKAAIDVDGTGDLIGQYGAMNEDGTAFGTSVLEQGQGLLGGTPWQFRDRYIENSPIFYLDRVETPLLIVHGTKDFAVAPSSGDELFVGLRRLGKMVEYAKYEGEGHSPSEWKYPNQVDFCYRMIAWFEKYLNVTGD